MQKFYVLKIRVRKSGVLQTEHGILFSKNGNLDIHGYTDADWAGNPNDRRSTACYFTFVGGNLVTWRSKKHKVVVLSSAEAEFVGLKVDLPRYCG